MCSSLNLIQADREVELCVSAQAWKGSTFFQLTFFCCLMIVVHDGGHLWPFCRKLAEKLWWKAIRAKCKQKGRPGNKVQNSTLESNIMHIYVRKEGERRESSPTLVPHSCTKLFSIFCGPKLWFTLPALIRAASSCRKQLCAAKKLWRTTQLQTS